MAMRTRMQNEPKLVKKQPALFTMQGVTPKHNGISICSLRLCVFAGDNIYSWFHPRSAMFAPMQFTNIALYVFREGTKTHRKKGNQ